MTTIVDRPAPELFSIESLESVFIAKTSNRDGFGDIHSKQFYQVR